MASFTSLGRKQWNSGLDRAVEGGRGKVFSAVCFGHKANRCPFVSYRLSLALI